jgi:hypothetical protein
VDGIFHIEQTAHLVTDLLAVIQRDAVLVVDVDTQEAVGRATPIFHAYQFVAQAFHRRLDQLLQLRWLLGHPYTANKKWAQGPLR